VVLQADPQATGISADGLTVLGRALAAAAQRSTLADALEDVANAARVVARADLVLARILVDARLEAIAVAGPPALAAELEGTHLPAGDLPQATLTSLAAAPAAVRHAASRGCSPPAARRASRRSA